MHGIAIEGTEDHDEMGVYLESPEYVVGLGNPKQHYIFRTQPEGARSGPGDVDLVSYSLRKYLPPRATQPRCCRCTHHKTPSSR